MTPALPSVSVAHGSEVDDLSLSQFPAVHPSSILDDDPYDLEVHFQVDLRGLEASFTNLTEQYAPMLQDLVAATQPSVAQEKRVTLDSAAKDDDAPAVGNPST